MDYTNICVQIEQWCSELSAISSDIRDKATQNMMMFRESQYPYEVCLLLLKRRTNATVCLHALLAQKSAFLREVGTTLTYPMCLQQIQHLLELYANTATFDALIINNFAHVLGIMYKRLFPINRENIPQYIYISETEKVEPYVEYVYSHIGQLQSHEQPHHIALGLAIVNNLLQEMNPENYSELHLPLLFHTRVKDEMDVCLLPRIFHGIVQSATKCNVQLLDKYMSCIEQVLVCISSNPGMQFTTDEEITQLLQMVYTWIQQYPQTLLVCCRILTAFSEISTKKMQNADLCLSQILNTVLLALQMCIIQSQTKPVEDFADILLEISNCVSVLSRNYYQFLTIQENKQVCIQYPKECIDVLQSLVQSSNITNVWNDNFGGVGIVGIQIQMILTPSIFIQYGEDEVSTWGKDVWTVLVDTQCRCITISPPNIYLQDDICHSTAIKYISLRMDGAAYTVQQSEQVEEDDTNDGDEENVLLKENDTSIALLLQYTSSKSLSFLRELQSQESKNIQHQQSEMVVNESRQIEHEYALTQERLYVLLDLLSLVVSEYAGSTVIEGSLPPFVLERASGELIEVILNIFALVSMFSANIQHYFLQRIHDELAVNTTSPFVTRFLLKISKNIITTYFTYSAPHALPAILQAQSVEGKTVASNIVELVLSILVCCGDDSTLCHDACMVLFILTNIPSLSSFLIQLESFQYILVFFKLACFSQNVMSEILPSLFHLDELPLVLKQSLATVPAKDIPMVLATRTNMDNPTLMLYTKIVATGCRQKHIPSTSTLVQIVTLRLQVLSSHPYITGARDVSEYDKQKCLEQLLTTMYIVQAIADEVTSSTTDPMLTYELLVQPLAFFNHVQSQTHGQVQTLVWHASRIYNVALQHIYKYPFLGMMQVVSLTHQFLSIVLEEAYYTNLTKKPIDQDMDIERIYDEDMDEKYSLVEVIISCTSIIQNQANQCTSPIEKIVQASDLDAYASQMHHIQPELLVMTSVTSQPTCRKLEMQKTLIKANVIKCTYKLWSLSSAYQHAEYSNVYSQSLGLIYTQIHDSHKYELLVLDENTPILEPICQLLDIGIQSGVATLRQNACSILHAFQTLHNFILYGFVGIVGGCEKAKNPISKLVQYLYTKLPTSSVGIYLATHEPKDAVFDEQRNNLYVPMQPNISIAYSSSSFKALLLCSNPLSWSQHLYMTQRLLQTLHITLQQCLFEKHTKLHIDEVTCLYDLLLACKYWDLITIALANTQSQCKQHILQNHAQDASISIQSTQETLFQLQQWVPPAVQQTQEDQLMGTRVITSVVNALVTSNTHLQQESIQKMGNDVYESLEKICIFGHVQDVHQYIYDVKQDQIDHIYGVFKELKDQLQTLLHSK